MTTVNCCVGLKVTEGVVAVGTDPYIGSCKGTGWDLKLIN